MTVRGALTRLWSYRRWVYATYMLFALARIPARTGFQMNALVCDARFTMENAVLSLTKVPHVVLFAAFFLVTAAMSDRVSRSTMAASLAATVLLGLIVELQQGVTRTGHCRLTDVLPDIVGALLGMAVLVGVALLRRHDDSHRGRSGA